MRSPRITFLLATLAAAVYAPFLALPFIANSFIEIPVSRLLASASGFHLLLSNANWHFRILYALLNSAIEQWFGFQPKPFYAASLALHVCCTLLIFGLVRWRNLPAGAPLWAAGFFALYHGHHGAVVSLTSWPDLLSGLCASASLFCWIRWLQGSSKLSYAFSLFWYLAAVLSNEPGFIAILLLLLPLITAQEFAKQKWLSLAPHAAIAVASLTIQLLMRVRPVAWSDSLPQLDPWWITLVWADAGLAVIALLRLREYWRLAIGCSAWLLIAFLVDLFYRNALHVGTVTAYMASIGLALLIGIAFSASVHRLKPPVAAVVALLVVAGNVTLLWTRSRQQMINFAAPTQALITAASFARGPIELTCFPYSLEVAEAAVGWLGGQIEQSKAGAQIRRPNCVSFRYRDSMGNVRQVYLRSTF